MRSLRFIALMPLLVLFACASPPAISSNPVTTVTNQVNAVVPQAADAGNTIVTGLQNAAFNFDTAMAIGALPGTDPASSCVHGVLKQLGADVMITPPGPNQPPTIVPVALPNGGSVNSFTPKVSDLISSGSVVYILVQQAKAIQAGGGVAVPTGCAAIIGQIVMDAAKTGLQAGAGVLTGGLLPPLLQ